ncbi:histidine kinase [Vallicoccus soli]|uniref:histidine kinase n=1 Tax=Vallicoccus soli TaxID=2339232 RepID=A0A3A3Z639_9ACTN|nr:histidine kinase [Vallicoccus soli]
MSTEELRGLFLFEQLGEAKLAAVQGIARVEEHAAGTALYTEGEPATCFYVLLEGELLLTRRVGSGEVEITRSSQRGAYCGATAAWVGERLPQVYMNSGRLTADGRLLVLDAADFAGLVRAWFPMGMHLLEGLVIGSRNTEERVSQRERLLALGQLSAGLTHELNNPAAAAVRATASLRERVAGMRHKLAMLADGHIAPAALMRIVDLQEATVERAAKAARLSPMELSDLEDEVGDHLEALGVMGPYDLAAVFAPAGLDVAWVDGVGDAVGPGLHEPALRWLAYTVETEQLMREIEDATERISTLLGAVRQYSQMDRAPYEDTDVVEGLESTLAMFAAKRGDGIRVVRDYAPDLPRVPAYTGELNQVWTNLIHNAVQAMEGRGTLTLRTRLDEAGGCVVVEVCDTGPGVPPELQRRIFEPFFTTKPVGEGTGLGLDISFRIVVQRHGGDLRVESVPGDTRFVVALPLQGARVS